MKDTFILRGIVKHWNIYAQVVLEDRIIEFYDKKLNSRWGVQKKNTSRTLSFKNLWSFFSM